MKEDHLREKVKLLNKLELFQKMGIFLDLAVEAHDLLRGDVQQEISGVSEDTAQFPHGTVRTIKILNKNGEKLLGRPQGSYITIDSLELRRNNWEAHQSISKAFADSLSKLITGFNLGPEDTILLVGLGNWNATPDALGPEVTNSVLVTRHLYRFAPQELTGGLRPVCAVSPGVLGITGIETAEIIKGIVERVQPQLIIAIDALAAGNVERIASTIQIADTGINPGSGIGNKRSGINRETMGIPVIAIGIPTVVNAVVIAFEMFGKAISDNQQLASILDEEKINTIIQQVLGSFGGNLTVTPKEIDELINNTARIIASGINQSLHVAVNPNDYAMYLQ